MTHQSYNRIQRIAAVILAAIILCTTFTITYADPVVPQNIKVGLSYSNAATNNFIIKSDTGVKVSLKNNTSYLDLFTYGTALGLKIRKDAHYNIVNTKETEINYTKAVQYSGELVGPYHIQIGEVYPDLNTAQQVINNMSSLTQTVFLAYEQGWKVWAQLYLDEAECLRQIEVFKNERPEYNYTVIAPVKKRVQLFDATTGKLLYIINAEQEIRFEPVVAATGVTTISYTINNTTTKYRGNLFIKRIAAGPINIANELPFEQYLYGVVPSEVPSSWHMEALKAQAVSARNYGILSIGKHTADGFDLCSGQHCQAYRGFSHENARTNQAVDETKGKLVVYNDKLVSTYFHSSSGGYTENSENIWTTALPYIRAVDDKYGLGSPHDNWTKKYTKDEIKTKLLANKIDVGDITDIVPLEISAYGRVTKLEIRGTKCNQILVKEKIRSIMGSSEIRSIWYTVSTDADIFVKDKTQSKPELERTSSLYVLSANGMKKLSDTGSKVFVKDNNIVTGYNTIPQNYVFTGKGWGHGLGMSQYGAKGMAEAGFNFIQILEYYFTGAKVK